MNFIYETTHYGVVVLDDTTQAEREVNYGIMNKEHGVIEAMCSALFMAHTLMTELETKLGEIAPVAPATITRIQ